MGINENRIPEIRFPGFTGAWEQRKFGEITELKSAARVHKEEWTDSGVPFYRSSDVMAALNGKENTKAFISEELYEKLSAQSGKLEEGDILITGGGSVGNPYKVPNNEPLYTKDADLLWVKRNERLCPDFVYQYFLSPVFRDYLASISHVGTIAHYTIIQLANTPISLPSIEEQIKVGEFLTSLDNAITLHQHKCDEVKTLKSAMLQKMFPKTGSAVPEIRFRGFVGDWEQRKVSDITKSYSGGTPQAGNPDYYNGDIPFIRSGEIYGDHTELFITQRGMDNSSAKMVSKGDILYALYGATSGEVSRARLDGAINQAILAIIPDENYNADFLVEWFRKEKANIIDKYLQGGQGNLSAQIIKGLDVSVPSFKEQEMIGQFFSELNNTIALHQNKCDELKELKKAMLQKMFV